MLKLKFIIACREDIEKGLAVRVPHIVISIRDPASPSVRLKKNYLCQAVLRLAFHDAEPSRNFILPANIRPMTKAHARAIWRFVRQHLPSIRAIVVHCEQGMSRSPAVAAGLSVGLGGDDEQFVRDYYPNQHVYALVLQASIEGQAE
jgi:predicted protein tyrosine phosphatase